MKIVHNIRKDIRAVATKTKQEKNNNKQFKRKQNKHMGQQLFKGG